jgi:hypothetical protein
MSNKIKIAIASLAAIVLIAVLVFTFTATKAQNDAIMKNGVDTAAVSETVKVDRGYRNVGSGDTKKRVRVITYKAAFSYNVEGTKFTIESKKFSNKNTAKRFLNQKHTIRYLAEDPNKAIILDGK